MTDQSGNVIARHDYPPFGEEIPANTAGRSNEFGSTVDVTQKFTGKERDADKLDYFRARYYASVLGRFTSPDETLADQHADDPQSWNLYGYGRNNPLNGIDLNGRDGTVCENDGTDCTILKNDLFFDAFNKSTGNYVAGGKYYDSGGNQIGTASWAPHDDFLSGAALIGQCPKCLAANPKGARKCRKSPGAGDCPYQGRFG